MQRATRQCDAMRVDADDSIPKAARLDVATWSHGINSICRAHSDVQPRIRPVTKAKVVSLVSSFANKLWGGFHLRVRDGARHLLPVRKVSIDNGFEFLDLWLKYFVHLTGAF